MSGDHKNQNTHMLKDVSLSRRGFLSKTGKVTLGGAILLSVGTGAAWITSSRASRQLDARFQVLRNRDVTFFRSVLPAIISGATRESDQLVFLNSMDKNAKASISGDLRQTSVNVGFF